MPDKSDMELREEIREKLVSLCAWADLAGIEYRDLPALRDALEYFLDEPSKPDPSPPTEETP